MPQKHRHILYKGVKRVQSIGPHGEEDAKHRLASRAPGVQRAYATSGFCVICNLTLKTFLGLTKYKIPSRCHPYVLKNKKYSSTINTSGGISQNSPPPIDLDLQQAFHGEPEP